MKKRLIDRQNHIFFFALICFSAVLFLCYYNKDVNAINGTMLAFSYKYGFISRGLIGTIYQLLDRVLAADMMNYAAMRRYTQVITGIYYLILFIFYGFCLRKCENESQRKTKYLIVFFTVFAIPMFCAFENFGRLDIYMVMLSLLGAILIIQEKFEFLLVPISAIGVMVHQGYVFMFLNVILILLIYKTLTYHGKKRIKYGVLFLACFGVASGLFLWFEFFSHMNGENIYAEIVARAESICKDGYIHGDVIDHEILGIDLADREWEYHLQNFVELPIFIMFMSPFLVYAVKFFVRLIKNTDNIEDKIKYVFVSIGALTIVPNFILKVDYGRWMFAIVCYYFVVILALLAMKDKHVERELFAVVNGMKEKYLCASISIGYLVLFQPFLAVPICELTVTIARRLNELLLHLW